MVFELAPGKYSKEDLEAKFKDVTEAIKKVRCTNNNNNDKPSNE